MPLPTLPSAIDLSPFRSPPSPTATTPLSLFRPNFLSPRQETPPRRCSTTPLAISRFPFNFCRKGKIKYLRVLLLDHLLAKFCKIFFPQIRSRATNETDRDRLSTFVSYLSNIYFEYNLSSTKILVDRRAIRRSLEK